MSKSPQSTPMLPCAMPNAAVGRTADCPHLFELAGAVVPEQEIAGTAVVVHKYVRVQVGVDVNADNAHVRGPDVATPRLPELTSVNVPSPPLRYSRVG